MRGMLVLIQKSADPAICHIKPQRGRQGRRDTECGGSVDAAEAQSAFICTDRTEGASVALPSPLHLNQILETVQERRFVSSHEMNAFICY